MDEEILYLKFRRYENSQGFEAFLAFCKKGELQFSESFPSVGIDKPVGISKGGGVVAESDSIRIGRFMIYKNADNKPKVIAIIEGKLTTDERKKLMHEVVELLGYFNKDEKDPLFTDWFEECKDIF